MAAYIAVERRIFRAIAPTLPPPPRFLTVIRLLYEMGKDPTSAVSVPPPHLSYVLPSRFKIILSRENFRYDVSNSSSRNLFNFDRTFSLTKLRLISIRYSARTFHDKGGSIWAWVFEGTRNTAGKNSPPEYETLSETCRANFLDPQLLFPPFFPIYGFENRSRDFKSSIIIPMNWNFFPIRKFENLYREFNTFRYGFDFSVKICTILEKDRQWPPQQNRVLWLRLLKKKLSSKRDIYNL